VFHFHGHKLTLESRLRIPVVRMRFKDLSTSSTWMLMRPETRRIAKTPENRKRIANTRPYCMLPRVNVMKLCSHSLSKEVRLEYWILRLC
jgi:hypothetical protein